MRNILNLFKANGFNELSVLGQILLAVEQNFTKDLSKYVNGESGRDVVIDELIRELQLLKSPAQETPAA